MAPCITNIIRALRICSNELIFIKIKQLFVSEYEFLDYPPQLLENLNSWIGRMIKKHSHGQEDSLYLDAYFWTDEPSLHEEHLFPLFPPTSTFCLASRIHDLSISIWDVCRGFLPLPTKNIALQLRRDVKSALSNKSIYYVKINERSVKTNV